MQKKTFLTLATLTAAMGLAFTGTAFAERGPENGGLILQMFDAIDVDKDGKVTQAEIDTHRAARVTAADANGDGLMSADELAAMRLAEMTERAKTDAAEMITKLDSDGDGLLSAAEMATRPASGKLFDRADTDDDGAISRDEATAVAEKMANRRHEGGRKHHDRDDEN
jgi:Ca2+-binding EF-hand superfamily protein